MICARALLLALLVAAALQGTAAELKIAVFPSQSPDALGRYYHPTVELLRRKLDLPVQLLVARDYDDVTQRLVGGAADVGFFGTASYVLARMHHPGIRYLATVMRPDDHYYCLVVVKQGSPVKSLADARGRSVGLTDKQSTSGYLVPRRMFDRAGVNLDRDARVFLLGRHHRVFDALAYGAIEVGAADSGAWNAAVKKHGEVFRVLARSAPIPRDPVAAAPHVDAALAARIQTILSDARADPEFAREASELKGYAVRSERFYDTIRKIIP